MTETERISKAVLELAKRPNLDPDIALLAEAVLHLYQKASRLHDTDVDAFEQIKELDRRQGADDTGK